VVKQARHANVEFSGTRSGRWLTAFPASAGFPFADDMPPPSDEPLFLLGVAHRSCVADAYERLRRQEVDLPAELPSLLLAADVDGPAPDVHLPSPRGTCPFCQGVDGTPSEEHLLPKWLQRELLRRGALL
jgi:hypothetical protein